MLHNAFGLKCMLNTYIQTYGHTDIQTYRHTDIQTYRHTDIQTYRHTDIQTYIYICIISLSLYIYIYTYTYIYIYIYIHNNSFSFSLWLASRLPRRRAEGAPAARGDVCDSSVMLIQRGGIPRSIGDLPESLSRAMLVGTMLVGRLGVAHCERRLGRSYIIIVHIINYSTYH